MNWVHTDGGVVWSLCWSRSWALQKRVNWWRCHFGLTQVSPRNHVVDGGRDPHGFIYSAAKLPVCFNKLTYLLMGRAIFGLSCPLKSIGSLCSSALCRKISITMTAGLRQLAALLQTGRCRITLKIEKSATLQCGLYQNSLTACWHCLTYVCSSLDFQLDSVALFLYKALCCFILSSGGLLRVDLIKWVSDVRPLVCPYVRMPVHKKFLQFQWNLVCR